MKLPMTDAQYRKAGGGVCPVCQGDQVEGESVDIKGDNASQDVGCLDCGAEWRDVYHLRGYVLTAKGEKVAQFSKGAL